MSSIGRTVATLVDGWRSAGSHAVDWNALGIDDGVYYSRLRAGSEVIGTRVVVVR
ncbi:MAG: hypothetical protein H7X80_11960 [bacterium]|nr:hypothetical protein [Candidatus Kapabacteria bacterium]